MYYDKSASKREYFLFFYGNNTAGEEAQFTAPHCHDSYELMVVTRGAVHVVLNGEPRFVRAGEILFLDRYDIHSFTFENCERYSLVFSGDFCRMLSADGKTLPSYPSCDAESFQKIEAMLRSNYAIYGEAIPSSLLVESLVTFVLGTIEVCCGKVERREHPNELMVEVLKYINENSKSELTLADVAVKFGYTPSYFSSLFNRLTQMNFNDYLNYVRYTKAVEIIQLQGCTATNIAMKCGFGSMNTFYRAKNKFDKES